METTSLTDLAAAQLEAASTAPHGRSAATVYGGQARTLRQTVVALAAGHSLDEHESPGDATLQVLRGRVRLTTGESAVEAAAGDLVAIPAARHGVTAVEAAAFLLTVAKPR